MHDMDNDGDLRNTHSGGDSHAALMRNREVLDYCSCGYVRWILVKEPAVHLHGAAVTLRR